MPIKTTMSYSYIPTRTECSYVTGGWQCPMAQTIWKAVSQLNMHFPRDPAISLLGICPKGMKICVHIKTCAQMYTAVLFTVVKKWSQPKCLLTNEWINRCTPTMEYRSATQGNDLYG